MPDLPTLCGPRRTIAEIPRFADIWLRLHVFKASVFSFELLASRSGARARQSEGRSVVGQRWDPPLSK